MGYTAHITAHFCGIPARLWVNPWQQASHARAFTASRISRVRSQWQTEATANQNDVLLLQVVGCVTPDSVVTEEVQP